MLQARREIAVNGSDLLNLQVVLQPAAAIPVTVTHAPANATPEAEQAAQNPGVSVTLLPAELFSFNSYGTQQQGDPPVLSIPNVTPGKYKVDIQSYGAECVESAWYGNVDFGLRDYLVVGEGQAQPITINLRADCATLTAKLKPSEHSQQGFLLVVPSSSVATPKVMPIAAQNPSGQSSFYPLAFSPFNTLSPGTYQVYAFSTLDGLEYSNPEALRNYPAIP